MWRFIEGWRNLIHPCVSRAWCTQHGRHSKVLSKWIDQWKHRQMDGPLKRAPSRLLEEAAWALTYGGWAVFVVVFLPHEKLHLLSSSPKVSWFELQDSDIDQALNDYLPPFNVFSSHQGHTESLALIDCSQLPPPGSLLWIALQKVKIIASSPGNLWSNVATVRDSAFQCRFHGFSVKHCKVTVYFSKISALHKSFWLHLAYNTIAAEFMNILLRERKGKVTSLNKLLFCKVFRFSSPPSPAQILFFETLH